MRSITPQSTLQRPTSLRALLLRSVIALVFVIALLPGFAFAQVIPAVDTPTAEPPTLTATPLATDTPTNTPTEAPTEISPTGEATPAPTSTPEGPPPEPEPIPIPEPITTVLFGTGLAAITAAVAARRRNKKQ